MGEDIEWIDHSHERKGLNFPSKGKQNEKRIWERKKGQVGGKISNGEKGKWIRERKGKN